MLRFRECDANSLTTPQRALGYSPACNRVQKMEKPLKYAVSDERGEYVFHSDKLKEAEAVAGDIMRDQTDGVPSGAAVMVYGEEEGRYTLFN